MKRRLTAPKHLLPKPSKIIKRGMYEMISNMTGGNTKPRNYGKKIAKGGY